MARLLRIHFPGANYHITGRMLEEGKRKRNLLFREDEDRELFLLRLEQSVRDFEVRLFAYCLMSNRFHLLVETPRGNLSDFMQSLNTGYTVYFNRRYQRHGPLLGGRFKSDLVAGDAFLLKLSRHIHLNPVEVASWKKRPIKDRRAALRAYRWSSYRSYIGKKKAPEFLETGPLYSLAKRYGKRGAPGFREYVEHGLANDDIELQENLKHAYKGIGDAGFRQKVHELRNKLSKKRKKPKKATFGQSVNNLPAKEILSVVAQFYKTPVSELIKKGRGNLLRPITARMLFRFGGFTQREIASMLGLTTGAAVSFQLRRVNELESSNRKIKNQLSKLEDKIRRHEKRK